MSLPPQGQSVAIRPTALFSVFAFSSPPSPPINSLDVLDSNSAITASIAQFDAVPADVVALALEMLVQEDTNDNEEVLCVLWHVFAFSFSIHSLTLSPPF